MSDIVEPLSFQRVGKNGTITLRQEVLNEMSAKPGDWIVLLPGRPGSNVVLLRRNVDIKIDYEDTG